MSNAEMCFSIFSTKITHRVAISLAPSPLQSLVHTNPLLSVSNTSNTSFRSLISCGVSCSYALEVTFPFMNLLWFCISASNKACDSYKCKTVILKKFKTLSTSSTSMYKSPCKSTNLLKGHLTPKYFLR